MTKKIPDLTGWLDDFPRWPAFVGKLFLYALVSNAIC